MTTRELVDVSLCAAAVVMAAWVFARVSREEIRAEDTATEEMRARRLGYYTNHLNEKPAAVDAATGRESSRSGLRPVRHLNVTSAAQD